MVFSHVIWGRPGGLFQFSGGEPLGSSWHLCHHPYVQCAQNGKMPLLDYCCKVGLLGYPSHLHVANKLDISPVQTCAVSLIPKGFSLRLNGGRNKGDELANPKSSG